MAEIGGRLVARALEDEGIELAFGIPGTHNIELYDALAESKRVRTILVTDEQSASFMADGAWRASGRMACVNVVPGAGLTHAMSGIAEAFMDTVPMLVLGCGIRRDTGRAFQLHDVDQAAMVAPVTKAQLRPGTARELYATIRKACEIARSGAPGPVFVEVPAELYLLSHDVSDEAPFVPATAVVEADTAQAAAILNNAKRPLVYLGLGAANAKVVELIERLESPVSTTYQGKGVVPETHPLFLWPGFGDAAPAFAREIARECDATLAIGCRFGEVATASYGLEPPEPLIHVDIDASVLGRNHTPALAIQSDAARFVESVLPRLSQRPRDDKLRARIRRGHDAVRREWLGASDMGRVSPFPLLDALQRTFGDETIFTTDSGNGTFIAMEMLRLKAPGRFLGPIDYSCMGYAVPAAIGAKLARPAAPVVALAGDGAFLMTGLELLTAASQRAAVVVVVLRDRELAQIAQFQDTAMNRKTASIIGDYDVEAICRGVGVECLQLRHPGEIDSVLTRALEVTRENRPVAVDCAIDYSRKTFFTSGVVKTNFGRLPWRDRLRYAGRAILRRVTG
ncbi:MAG TPA: thiamine pyrophosphate-binding protein [Gemmatimonadaceae bacterium]|nr:thiamine pyrophosphate-binding protein [Gemmatimonadaceae bacterium]